MHQILCVNHVISVYFHVFIMSRIQLTMAHQLSSEVPSFSEYVSHALEMLDITDITLKAEQLLTMEAIYRGNDCFVCLQTGYGKSLCFSSSDVCRDFCAVTANSGACVSHAFAKVVVRTECMLYSLRAVY